jgi:cellulose synthase/poly-beta-1,6-N-acetylglucosamine synthase-like glycosyltransferase
VSLEILLALYCIDVVVLSAYAVHAGVLLLLRITAPRRWVVPRTESKNVRESGALEDLPHVTVQIPVFDECHVIERAILAASRLDYPGDRLQIQILDDSTDETHAMARDLAQALGSGGVDIEVLHRTNRYGYKAGALAAAMPRARGEFVAVLDADFVPPRGWLREIFGSLRVFEDPEVGFVQCRWSYHNREQSALTRGQAVLLDKHFLIEQPARSRSGLFFNFNGSGGIWRKTCLVDAGGWQDDTLTEDLDLSYRAQIHGWRGVFLENVSVPGELPSTLVAFKRQQRRWARGSSQTVRKLASRILGAPASCGQKLAACLHLTSYFFQPFLLGFILLWPQVVLADSRPSGTYIPVWLHLLSTTLVLASGALIAAHWTQRRNIAGFTLDLPAALALAVGTSFSNTVGVFQGLVSSRPGKFERTPKNAAETSREEMGDFRNSGYGRYDLWWDPTVAGEIAMAGYGVWAVTFLWRGGFWLSALAMAFYAIAYATFAWSQLARLVSMPMRAVSSAAVQLRATSDNR